MLIIVFFSAIIHEVMHGVAAEWLGDKTARYAGRITLNPLVHIDPFGTILLPFLCFLANSPIYLAYAKPVPYNPYNLRPGRFSEAIVAGAGPLSNAVIALLCAAVIRTGLVPGVNDVLFLVVVINIVLCFFNLIPIPPLDGSKVFASLLPRSLEYRYTQLRYSFERNPLIGMIVVVLFVYLLGDVWGNFIYSIAGVLTGVVG